MINPANVTTGFELPHLRTTQNLGLVRGITVRSLISQGSFSASLQLSNGDNLKTLTELCEKAREEALERMLQHAMQLGANAVVGIRYDTNEIGAGVTEVLAYGTAVLVQ